MLKIVVDSGCDLNKKIVDCGFEFEQVPLSLNIDGTTYIDNKNLDIDSYLTAMENSPNPILSAAPSPEAFYNAFKGANEIYCVTISSGMSGSYNSAVVARDMFLEDFPDAKVYVIDSRLATSGETTIVCKLIDRLHEGLRRETLMNAFNEDLDSTVCYFILESFKNLTKNGRMNPTIAKIASVMNIKPVCKGFQHDITLEHKCRGTKKAYEKLVEVVVSDHKLTELSTIYITHIQSFDAANLLKTMISERAKVKEIIINECSGLCAGYAERFGLVVGY